jgi:UDP-N-acetylglucosamine 2-epimerase
MVGNSSSGIIEAPSFGLPVVNIGKRQEGRERAANVVDSSLNVVEIRQALNLAVSDGFQASLVGMVSPFRGERRACDVIVDKLTTVDLGDALLMKRWYEGGAS